MPCLEANQLTVRSMLLRVFLFCDDLSEIGSGTDRYYVLEYVAESGIMPDAKDKMPNAPAITKNTTGMMPRSLKQYLLTRAN